MELCAVCSGEMRHTLSLNKDSYYRFLYVVYSKEQEQTSPMSIDACINATIYYFYALYTDSK